VRDGSAAAVQRPFARRTKLHFQRSPWSRASHAGQARTRDLCRTKVSAKTRPISLNRRASLASALFSSIGRLGSPESVLAFESPSRQEGAGSTPVSSTTSSSVTTSELDSCRAAGERRPGASGMRVREKAKRSLPAQFAEDRTAPDESGAGLKDVKQLSCGSAPSSVRPSPG